MNVYVVRRSVAYLPTSAPCPFNDKLGLLFIQVPIFEKERCESDTYQNKPER